MLKIILAFIMFCSSPAFASIMAHSREEIAGHFRAAGYSGVIGVFAPDIAFEEAFGAEGGRPVTVNDHFLIGSISKQFTAAAVLKLRDQGRLSLHDRVTKHIPSFRDPEVTIHHLLAQTSGVGEITETPQFRALKKRKFVTLDPLVALIVELRPDFPAGRRWAYSNSNYLLLSKIVEAASGESWWSYVKRELVDPAGMKETSFSSDRGPAVVSGHDFNRDYALIAIAEIAYLERGWANGAGGIESTAKDLSLWNSALYGGRLLSPLSLTLMTTAHGKVNGTTSYGYGLFIAADKVSGETFYYHPGGIPGFISYNSYYPKRKLTTVAVANYAAVEPIDFAHALARLEIAGTAPLQPYNDDPSVPTFPLEGFSGSFVNEEGPGVFDLVFENGKLYAAAKGQPQHRLVIRGEGRFYDRSLGGELKFKPGSKDEFEMSGENGVTRFRRWERGREFVKLLKRALIRSRPRR